MKRTVLLLFLLSGCASIAQDGVPPTPYQSSKPVNGHRQLSGFFLLDLLFPPALIYDFSTTKIYREYPRGFYPNHVERTVTDAQWRKWKKDDRLYERNQNKLLHLN